MDRPLGALVRTNSVVMILETKPWSNTPAWRAPRTITIKENGKGVKIHPRELADVGTALLDAQVRVGQRRDVKVGERFRGFEIRWMRALPKEPTTRQ